MRDLEFRDVFDPGWSPVTNDVEVEADESARLVKERRR